MRALTFKYFPTIVLLALISNLCIAVTRTWSAGGDGSWSTAGNWSPSGIPTAGDDITIDCSCTVSISADMVFDGSLTIAAGSTLDLGGKKFEIGKNDNTVTLINNGTIQNSSDFKIKGFGVVGEGPFGTNNGTITVTKFSIGNNNGGGDVTNSATGIINVTNTVPGKTPDESLHVDGTLCNQGVINVTLGATFHGAILKCGGILNASSIELEQGKGAGGATGGASDIQSQSFADINGCSGGADDPGLLYYEGDNTTPYTYQELLDGFGLSSAEFELDPNNVTSCGQAPLPVELLYFSAKVEEVGEVKIEWATATETNNDYFIVERSTNGSDWEEVSMIGGAGNSTETLYYSDADANPRSGISYYQLKQVDYDGTQSFSEIVPVSIKYRTTLRLSPNPTTDSFVIEGEDIENSEISMTNMLGQKARISIIANTNEALIQTSSLEKGAYLVAINRNGIKDVRKVLIQ